MTTAKTSGGQTKVSSYPPQELDPQTRIDLIRQGIPAFRFAQLSARLGISKQSLCEILQLSPTSIYRKLRCDATLSKNETERVLGIEELVGIIQTMAGESGEDEMFEAGRWLGNWMSKPLPALGGATPASYFDTFEGQKLVGQLLRMSQSGAYA